MPETTPDGRYVVVGGRKWRATDPSIPPALAGELRHELMAARRAVGDSLRHDDQSAEQMARRRVADAKVALGERGRPWWEPIDDAALLGRSAATARSLLRRRAETASICPSDVAKVVRFDDWREVMPAVRRSMEQLVASDEIVVTRGNQTVDSFVGGPVRLRRGPRFPA